ncbi:glycoside hydrolase family 95 protein, partial [Streptomyces shenzhenensis]|uniref:glycoside hydrolase family 95 protein n=1 Tax=Streptomyces shenzhenensis TaxID=943815 RepID=UPI0015F0E995
MPRHTIQLTEPATAFKDSFLLGNGSLGATLRGATGTERIDLNLDTLWSGGPLAIEEGPAPARFLPELRKAVRAEDNARAEELAQAMTGPGWTESYQPVGWLEWDYADTSDASTGYHRRLDLADAVAGTRYGPAGAEVELSGFVSAPDNVLVLTATGPGTASETVLPRFLSPHPVTTDTSRPGLLVATGRVPARVLPNYVESEPAVVYGQDEPDENGTVAAGTGFAVAVAVERTGPRELRLIASVTSGFRGYDQRPSADLAALARSAEETVARALTLTSEQLAERHVQEYRSRFDRVDFDLSASPATGNSDPARAELLFHLGRYLLISSSRPGTQAANLQGIWNIDVRPGWSANYTTNINVEMNYWAAESTALQDVHGPLLTLASDLAESGTATAARYYGAAGAVVHHNTDIWRFSAPVKGDTQWATWPAGLYWLAAHVWDHYAYGGHDGFGATTALRVHRAAALFALDMLVPDDDGLLVTSPSTSPEHRFVVPPDGKAAVSEGTTMDQELVHEVLSRYLVLAERFGGGDDEGLLERARQALGALRMPGVGTNGELLEWKDERRGFEPGHRHLSHLYGLHPGTRITEGGTPEAFAAARRALATRLEHGSGYTGWSQAWILCLAARLRDTGLAERSLDVLLNDLTSTSLLDLHPHSGWPDGQIFQIDGNLGAVAGIVELLVQSHEGAVSLLKTLPRNWPSGHVTGIRCRGGLTVDVRWRDGALTSATLHTAGPGPVVVVAEPTLRPVQALVRWDPVGHAVRELAERAELGFPPVSRMAAVSGTAEAVAEFLGTAELPTDAEVLGPVPVPVVR